MALDDIFHQRTVTEILEPLLQQQGLDFTRDYCFNSEHSLATLISAGLVVRPSFTNVQHPRYRNFRIIDSVAKLGKNQVLIISQNAELFPDCIPAQRALKKLKTAKLKRYHSIESAVAAEVTPERLIEDTVRGVGIDDTIVGYDWKPLYREGMPRVVRLVDCVKGAVLEANSSRAEKVRVKSYDNCDQADGMAHAVVHIPSVAKEEVSGYDIRFSSVPIRSPNGLHYAYWFNLDAEHTCKKQSFAFTYGRRERGSDEKLFCFHEIAAYHRLVKYKTSLGDNKPVALNPFVVPNKFAFEFYTKLVNQVIREVDVGGKTRRRPLNQTDQEILLWKMLSLPQYSRSFSGTEYREYMRQ